MSKKTDEFIAGIAPLAVNEYLSRDKWILPSVCIAQAALESGWNLNASTLFGIKGKGFTATTTEYYNGHKVVIEDSFRKYPDVASAVVGYYDFLRDTPRYAKALNNPNYKDAVDKLIHTTDGAPYATAPNYIETVISIIEGYGLTKYDERGEKEVTIEEIIAEMKKKGFTVKTNNANELSFVKPAKVVKKVVKEGVKVKVKKGAKFYHGETPKDFVYDTIYDVLNVNGDKVLIGIGKAITGHMHIDNLIVQ